MQIRFALGTELCPRNHEPKVNFKLVERLLSPISRIGNRSHVSQQPTHHAVITAYLPDHLDLQYQLKEWESTY